MTVERIGTTGIAVAAIVLMLPGCREPQPDVPADSRPGTKERQDVSKIDASVPQVLLDRLRADAAATSGADQQDFELERAESVTWPDRSLGCPQPNMSYAQVLTPGWWVILRLGQEELDYRAIDENRFARCTGATKQAPIRYPSPSQPDRT